MKCRKMGRGGGVGGGGGEKLQKVKLENKSCFQTLVCILFWFIIVMDIL